ncbi:MAG TPA: VirB4 family type IV secretion/conjugal transfer ATPase [Steroidobacteraceae bacterium]|jgi:type IV secretion system protein VirB4
MRAAARRTAAVLREPTASRHIPYSAHISETVVKTFAGDYVQSFRLAGVSFESADDETLNNWHERLNVTLRNIASPNLALWTHVVRRRERTAPGAISGDGFADRLARRYRERLASETLMVNELYLSIVYRPVAGSVSSLASKLILRRTGPNVTAELADALEACTKLRETLIAALARYEPESLGLEARQGRTYSRLLEFFAQLINAEHQPVPLPKGPLNEVLATTRPLFGTEVIEYRLPTETRLGAMLGIKEYPTPTYVGLYNALLSAPFPFVLTQSFTFLTKATAQGLLQRQSARMANAGDFAVTQAAELTDALDALTGNEFVMGDHHFTLQVLAEEAPIEAGEPETARLRFLNDAIARARAYLADTGMTVAREDLGLEGATWAQLPGNFAYRPRKSPITSRNFAAMSAFHDYPSGRATGNHWGEALAPFVTRARSAFHFSLHASDPSDPDGGSRKDTGHTFVCGPTGSGKTVLVGFLISMLARQNVTQVVFDKDHGLEILVRALGGEYLPLRNGQATGFNPLQLPQAPANFEFLKTWLRALIRVPMALSAREEADLDHALRGTLALEICHRRLSRLIEFTDSTRPEGIHARLSRWCECTGGDYAWVFDNARDSLAERLEGQSVIGFDVTDFLDSEAVRAPITLYLFHLVRQLIDGRRFVCWADEFSRLLADPAFEAFAKDGLKVWRKLNGVFCAATQSPSDALASPISRTVIEQTATKIFFPNPDAQAEDYIGGFALSEREFKLLKEQMEPGTRMYIVKQGHHSIVCQLDLKGFDPELAVISGRASTVEQMRGLIGQLGPDPAAWLPAFMQLGERR